MTVAVTVAARVTVAAMAAARAIGGGDGCKGNGYDSGDGNGGGSGRGTGDGRCNCYAEGNGGGCGGNDESCRGNGGMSALSVLPLLQTSTMKYQLIRQSHPRLVKMHFLANRRVTAKGFYPTN